MELMPFNFDRLPNGQVFISNLAGFHHFIDEQELLVFLMSKSMRNNQTHSKASYL